jgi:hypothetical protein
MYYYLLRKKPSDYSNPNTITGSLKVLNKANFIYRTRTDPSPYITNNGSITSSIKYNNLKEGKAIRLWMKGRKLV